MKRAYSLAVAGLLALSATTMADAPEYRAVYAASFDVNTQTKCDNIIADILASNLNAVYVQVRARADASYVPNREDSTYPNTEPRGELYTLSPSDLDVLQYFIDRLHNATPPVQVHAWCTTYNSWNRSTAPVSGSHIYNAHPEWITEDSSGTTYTYSDDAPLDPGIPAVQDHIYNVFMDIVRNYDVDGIHFDYVRLLSTNSGYDPVALAEFQAETGFSYNPASPGALGEVYEAWRRDQIAQLVQRVHTQTGLEKPWVDVSAFLVNFTDSVENLAQGYNWWAAHGAIDHLHPGAYSSTVSGAVADYDFIVAKLAQNGDENAVPLVAALGSYLYVDGINGVDDPVRNTTAVTTLRGNSRVPDGFNFFDWGAFWVDGTPTYAADRLATDMFGATGPMPGTAAIPASFLKAGEETTPPNAPASVGISLVSGKPRITFNRPAAAGDGDLPVHYRLYRDTNSSVDLYYDNMVMEWWDPGSPRTSFTFDDVTAGGGTNYYVAVAYDEWNNRAAASAVSIVVSGPTEYIIETVSGMQNASDYSEPSGSWTNSSSHSTASGCTFPAPNPASRFATPGAAGESRNDRARFTPSSLATGTYDVYVTTYNFSSANAQDITVRINDAGGVSTTTFDLTSGAAGNTWALVDTINFTAGQGHYIEFDNVSQTNFGDSTNSRMTPCAVRLLQSITGTPTPKEPKPAAGFPTSSITEVIVDSEPTSLDYDDAGSWSTTTFSGSGTLYNGSARYYASASSLDRYATYVVDLPQAGNWAIDGWIRNEQVGLAQTVQYRFVDGGDVVRNTVATHQPGSGGWTINVDGVSDGSAYYFNRGRVYVTIYGNSGTSALIMADALRFRLITPGVEEWSLLD